MTAAHIAAEAAACFVAFLAAVAIAWTMYWEGGWRD